jgi:hypothetical protein
VPAIFLGVSQAFTYRHKAYICWDPIARKLYQSTNVTFDEFSLPFKEAYERQRLDALGTISDSDSVKIRDYFTEEDLRELPSEDVLRDLLDEVTEDMYAEEDDLEDCDIAIPMADPPSSVPSIPSAILVPPTGSNPGTSQKPDSASPNPLLSPSADPPELGRGHRIRRPNSKFVDSNAKPAPAVSSASAMHDLYSCKTSCLSCRITQVFRAKKKVKNTGRLKLVPASTVFNDPVLLDEWRESMDAEVHQFYENNRVTPGIPPPGAVILRGQFIFAKKFLLSGALDKLKTRYVIWGHTQHHGESYYDTYSPTVHQPYIRLLASIAAVEDFALEAWDVRGAFMSSSIDFDIWIRPIRGYEFLDSRTCLKLECGAYGLKQAARLWFLKVSAALVLLGFH